MKRSTLALFFSLLFMAYMGAPLVLKMVDKNIEITMFLDANEEEEKKGNESVKDLETKILSQIFNPEFDDLSTLGKIANHYVLKYSNEFLEHHSPPPEQNIL